MTAKTASSILTINTEAVRKNYTYLSEKSGHARCAPVVKADAYGCGIDAIIPALSPLNPPCFFVATLDEGLKARTYTSKPIAILNGLFKGAEDEYKHHNLTPVCGSIDDVLRARDFNLETMWQFDTGMNRLGIRFDECEKILNLNPPKPSLILSHFIASEVTDAPENKIQIDKFDKIKNHCTAHFKTESILYSLANSSGIFLNSKPHYDITRAGLALYGGNPTPEQQNPMQAVVSLNARILRIDTARTNETAGYNATYKFNSDTKIATISLGYADGIFRSASSRLNLYWHGQACPVRGRISMDLVIVDISNISPHTPQPQIGDFMEVIGTHQTLETLAKASSTINYEILTPLSNRATRIIT